MRGMCVFVYVHKKFHYATARPWLTTLLTDFSLWARRCIACVTFYSQSMFTATIHFLDHQQGPNPFVLEMLLKYPVNSPISPHLGTRNHSYQQLVKFYPLVALLVSFRNWNYTIIVK